MNLYFTKKQNKENFLNININWETSVFYPKLFPSCSPVFQLLTLFSVQITSCQPQTNHFMLYSLNFLILGIPVILLESVFYSLLDLLEKRVLDTSCIVLLLAYIASRMTEGDDPFIGISAITGHLGSSHCPVVEPTANKWICNFF